MKSKTVKSLLCAALMAMTLSMTACGGSDAEVKGEAVVAENVSTEEAPVEEETSTEEEAPVEEETSAEEDAPAEEEASGDESAGDMTLEDYLNAVPEQKQQLEEQIAAQAEEGMSIAIEVKENDFTYIYTIEDASLITDELKENLKTGLDATTAAFEAMAGSLDNAMGESGVVTLIVRYQDADGNVLEERSFNAGE